MSDRPVRTRARRAVTGRALVLGTLVVLLIVLLASPLSRYFGSRSDLSHASQQLTDDQKQLAVLNQQYAQWSDPGFVQQQARERLQYAMPGDTVYVVVNHGEKSQIQKSEGTQASGGAKGSWNTRLWTSVEHAGK
ncbi:MAG: septum formation initiator family protein [Jatrophihabitantaceae bacterium]